LDNVTHTLIGALVGETAARHARPLASDREANARRTLFLSVTVVGSSLPDVDLFYTWWSDNKLDYLLEHRGHTHTVIGALVLSVAMLVVTAIVLRWRRIDLPALDKSWLVGLALLAPQLHIAMDALNVYGVHPWWPFDNRWRYGDAVFIVEPLFWAAAAPLAFLFRTYAARGSVVVALAGGVYLAVVTRVVAPASIAGYCLLVLAMLACGRYARPKAALVAGIAVWLTTTLVFTISGREAHARVDVYASQHLARWTTRDRVLSPLPMNPFCWELILIQTQGDSYALRRAIVSTAPAQLLTLQCPESSMNRAVTAPLRAVELPDAPYLRWHGELVESRERLRRIVEDSCEAAALLRFARAPWYAKGNAGTLVGDLRFDREPGLGFAELDLTSRPRCPAYVPPWVPPRSDILQ
jgi:inner membrane protein